MKTFTKTLEVFCLLKCNQPAMFLRLAFGQAMKRNASSFFFLYMINIAYCNLKDFDYATDLLSDLSLGIETSVVDRLICYLYFNSPVILAQLQVLAGSAHGLIQ